MTVLLLGYRATLGEPDLTRMVSGLVYGGATGLHMAAGFHYGQAFSFGFYQLLYLLIPGSSLLDPDAVARYLNYTGAAFTFLFAVGLILMLHRLLSGGAAAFTSVAFLFCPLSLPFLASGHPMIGACALLFLATWLLLLTPGAAWPSRLILLGLAGVALLAGLTLRAEIAMALPFVLLACWAHEVKPVAASWSLLAAVAATLALVFAAFLFLQKPYVETSGGAGGSLGTFLSEFISLGRVSRGLVVAILGMGMGTAGALLAAAVYTCRKRRVEVKLMLACLALLLPSLLFWLPNPQPARHFILPVLALYMLLGVVLDGTLQNHGRAILLALALVAVNQIMAELMHGLIVKHYQWSYAATGRRATQQAPIGFYLLDQRANLAAQAQLREEGRQFAYCKAQQLLILADAQQYITTQLIATDPSLRLSQGKLGPYDVLELSNQTRHIYLLDKLPQRPKDVLAEVLTMPALQSYPIYVQPATISRFDQTPLPEKRRYIMKPSP